MPPKRNLAVPTRAWPTLDGRMSVSQERNCSDDAPPAGSPGGSSSAEGFGHRPPAPWPAPCSEQGAGHGAGGRCPNPSADDDPPGLPAGGASSLQFLSWLTDILPSKVGQALVGTAKFLFGGIAHTVERQAIEAAHE